MTRGDLTDRILAGLNESTTAPVLLSRADVATVIDEAAEIMAEELGAVRRTVLVDRRPGTTYYPLSGLGQRLIAPFRIWDHARNYRLPAVSYDELDRRMRNWPTASGFPVCWFPVSWDLFGVWPHMGEGGGILRVDCYAWPRPLLDDADEPELLEIDQDALTAYGFYAGALQRWDADSLAVAWNEFSQRFTEGQGRAGSTLQARTWQRGRVDDLGLRSGIERI